jgi:hypothetical protein
VPRESIRCLDYTGASRLGNPRGEVAGFIRECAGKEVLKAVIYYSGHGERGSGAWCFDWIAPSEEHSAHVKVEPKFVFEELEKCGPNAPILEIISESCSSGHWCDEAQERQMRGRVLAASAKDAIAWADPAGSHFTDWLLGRNNILIELAAENRKFLYLWNSQRQSNGPMQIESRATPSPGPVQTYHMPISSWF